MQKLRTVGCFLEHDGKFVILYRRKGKPSGETWALPGGKVEPGESDEAAMLRELKEETSYAASPDELESLGNYVFNFPDFELTLSTFRIKLKKPHKVQPQPGEHQAHRWVTPEECYAVPTLIRGFHELLVEVGYVKL